MKGITISLIVVCIVFSTAFCQVSLTDTTTVNQESSNKDETQDKPTETFEGIENPFLSGDEASSQEEVEETDDSETSINPFLSQEDAETSSKPSDELEQKRGIDLLLDLSVGLSLSRFTIEPNTISTNGKPNFLFEPGILIPFARYFYGAVGIRYLRLSVNLSYSLKTEGEESPVTLKEKTDELMTFISVPCELGMRFELGAVTPYIYADIEPAYLTAASQFIDCEKHAFVDGLEITIPETEDRNTTDYRERHQVFIGGGMGIDISYGYGSVYIDGGCQFALFDTDEGSDIEKSRPPRTSSKVIYFPISIGIRFYL